MSRLARVASFLTVVCVCTWTQAIAQTPNADGESPAHISVVDGTAVLERDGRTDAAPLSMPLLAGDRVRTQEGRVEVLFADGSTLHLDTHTVVDFQSDDVIRLLSGRVRVSIAGSNRPVGYRIDAPSAWVQILRPGEYRVAVAAGDEIELAVLRGAAELVNEDGRTALGAGERAFARAGSVPSSAYVFNSAAWDAFDRWSEQRRDSRLGVNAEYLPETVQPYAATFAEYGTWQQLPTYGRVWYPRVRPGWRPYYYGRWTTLRPWGWTWVGSDPWAWPTHHFGRWGFSAGAWFWIPGRTWGPAWVSWAYAPGYVSWCPLGWNNRPVLQFVNVNVYGSRYDPWHAWTVVPHGRLGHGYVNINVVRSTHIDVRTRESFVVRNTSPDVVGYAVPRSSAPIRTAVSRDQAFGGTTAFRGTPRVTTGASTGTEADPSAGFRSRRSSGAPLSGPGYPAPARTPERTAPRRESGYSSTAPAPSSAPAGAVRSRESGSSAAPAAPGSMERRAVPRTAPQDNAAAPARSESTPSRGRPEGSYRAVPRNERRAEDVYAPSRSYGVQQDRSPYRAPEANVPRATPAPAPAPRSEPDAPAYRARPGGVERSGPPPSGERAAPRSGMERPAPAPAGPPPSAAPSRAPERSPSSGGDKSGGRSRGDGQSSGRAVSRGRGGQ